MSLSGLPSLGPPHFMYLEGGCGRCTIAVVVEPAVGAGASLGQDVDMDTFLPPFIGCAAVGLPSMRKAMF